MDFNQALYWHEVFEADFEDAEQELEVERVVLPQTNPFQLSNHKFVQLFRLTKDLTNDLVEMVTPFMALPTRASALSIITKVLAALRFYASGSYQEVTGSNHFVSISQASMSRAINEVTNALNQQAVLNQKIQFPRTPPQQEALRTQFFEMYGFPGILGIIDCTHVAIVAPSNNDQNHPEHVYVNRKNYHSINVQLICDPFLKILKVHGSLDPHMMHLFGHSLLCPLLWNRCTGEIQGMLCFYLVIQGTQQDLGCLHHYQIRPTPAKNALINVFGPSDL